MATISLIYEFEDYRMYLQRALEDIGRGARLKLAQHLDCQSSFISQVLSGKNELSLEHTYKVSQFFKLDGSERNYLMTMVQLSRAGTYELREYFYDLLEKLRSQQMQIHKIVKWRELDKEDSMKFFSNWTYVAIYNLTGIKKYQDPDVLREKLQVSDSEFRSALEFLIQSGLVKEENGKYVNGEARLHLRKSSPHALPFSIMTRLKVIEKLRLMDPDTVNYGMVFTISEESLRELKKRVLKVIADSGDLIAQGEPSKFCSLAIDLVEH